MSLFDSIISEAGSRFGLGDKSGTLLSALLSLMTDQNRGGFAGFLDLFSKAGLGDVASSWISSGANSDLSDEQVESALGNDTITSIANQAGVNSSTAKSALAYLIPGVVDKLTPDGVVPEEKDLLSKIGDFFSGIGGTVAGAALGVAGIAGAVAGGATDKVGDAAGAAVGAVGNVAGAGMDAGKKAVGAVGDLAGGALGSVTDTFEGGGGGGILKWLLPLIVLGLVLLAGFWFCGRTSVAPTGNANANANKANTNANAGTNANANANTSGANTTANTGEKKLAEVSLPNGTKLQAYPGGIEDQLIKFIQSDEYKNGTEATLKDKWFSFDDLNFKFGSTELAPESKRQLDNIVAILKAFPDVKMKLGGYTDKKGNDDANLKLSDSRAKAVKAALEKAGVGAQVPQAEGYGEKFATVPETGTDEERKADRKTAVRLLKGDAAASPADANAKPAAANTANAANANR